MEQVIEAVSSFKSLVVYPTAIKYICQLNQWSTSTWPQYYSLTEQFNIGNINKYGTGKGTQIFNYYVSRDLYIKSIVVTFDNDLPDQPVYCHVYIRNVSDNTIYCKLESSLMEPLYLNSFIIDNATTQNKILTGTIVKFQVVFFNMSMSAISLGNENTMCVYGQFLE